MSELVQLQNGPDLTVDSAEGEELRPILLLPAMGVPADYYDEFVPQLTAKGHPVVRVHWRDEDRSFPKAHPDYGYADIAEIDVPAAAQYARERFSADPIVCGHSLGGQIAGISSAKGGPYAGIVVLASGSNYWRGSGAAWAFGVAFMTFFFAPLIVRIFGYWPGGWLGFGGRQCSGVMRDWARFGRTGKFLLEGATVDHEAGLRELDLPILALTVAGDRYVSPGATNNLISKFEHCVVEHKHWRAPMREHRGHFRWAKAPSGPAEIIEEWTERVEQTRVA